MVRPANSTAKSKWNSSPKIAHALFVLAVFPSYATGTQYRTPLAVETNLLVYDGKVAFIGYPSGLTILDFRTGQPLLRRQLGHDLGGVKSLKKCATGILIVSYSRASLVDATSFQPIWTIDNCHELVVEDRFIVAADGNHTVYGFDALNGEVRWSHEMEGGWELAICGTIALVYTPELFDGQQELWAIDAESGAVIFHRKPPDGDKWLKVATDGEYVYAIHGPQSASALRKLSGGIFKFSRLGEELDHVDLSSPSVRQFSDCLYPVLFDRHMLLEGDNSRRVYQHELNWPTKVIVANDREYYWLRTGVLSQFEQKDADGHGGVVVQLVANERRWTNYVSYVHPNEWLQSVQEVDDRILLCWSGGQIECLESATGSPQWLYVLPSLRRILSYSDTFIDTYWRSRDTNRAKILHLGLNYLGEKCGSVTMPNQAKVGDTDWNQLAAQTQYPATIIVDPVPDILFGDLPARLQRCWNSIAALVCGVSTLAVWFHWPSLRRVIRKCYDHSSAKRRYGLGVITFFIIGCAASAWLVYYRTISTECNVAFAGIAVIAFVYSNAAFTRLLGDNLGMLRVGWLFFCELLVLTTLLLVFLE